MKWNNFTSLPENEADLVPFSEELQNKDKVVLSQNELKVSGGFRDCAQAEILRNIDVCWNLQAESL